MDWPTLTCSPRTRFTILENLHMKIENIMHILTAQRSCRHRTRVSRLCASFCAFSNWLRFWSGNRNLRSRRCKAFHRCVQTPFAVATVIATFEVTDIRRLFAGMRKSVLFQIDFVVGTEIAIFEVTDIRLFTVECYFVVFDGCFLRGTFCRRQCHGGGICPDRRNRL